MPQASRQKNWAEGLERAGFSEEAIRTIKEAYRIIYRSKLNLQQAITEIAEKLPETPERQVLLDFISNSPRGIIK